MCYRQPRAEMGAVDPVNLGLQKWPDACWSRDFSCRLCEGACVYASQVTANVELYLFSLPNPEAKMKGWD